MANKSKMKCNVVRPSTRPGKKKTRSFPYNAVGKAQATEFAKTMGGTKTDNPNTRMTEMGY